jgi:hypothetical protein
MQIQTSNLIAVLLLVASSYDVFPAFLRAADDPLDVVIAASRESVDKVRTASGTGTFEVSNQKPGEKDPSVRTKAEVNVHYADGKYSLHLDYQTLLATVVVKNPDGTETKRESVETKPDSLYLLDDGTLITEVKFTPRITPTGCAGHIFARENPSFPFKDVVHLTREIDIEAYLKNLGRAALSVEDLPSGIRRVSGWVKNSKTVRFELDADPKVAYNIVAMRVFNDPEKEPASTTEISWKKTGDLWYGERIAKTHRTRDREGKAEGTGRLVFQFSKFSPNVEINPSVFTFTGMGVPLGARFVDGRADAPHRILYFNGTSLGPERPSK